ncbi:MAG: ABC transporter permease [Acidobacteriota bacterium]
MRDLRFAIRQLLKHPGFTAVAVLSLALGIGATTTVFCWIQSVLLHPLPGVAEQDRMVVLVRTQGDDDQVDTINLPTVKDLAGLKEVFAGVIGSDTTPAYVTINDEPIWLYGQIATTNFFQVLGVQPILGHTFAVSHDDTLGAQPVIVLSETCWRRHFGADPTWLHTQARLQPGVSIAQAQAAVDALMYQLEQAYPVANREVGTRVLPVWKAPYGAQSILAPVLGVLFVVGMIVLLIVIANVANLLLARALARRKEMAIRLATGAGHRHIIRQMTTEGILLAALGCAGGLVVTVYASGLLRIFVPNTHLPVSRLATIDAQTLGFGMLVALVTGVVFGLISAVHALRSNTSDVLKEGGRSSASGQMHHRLRGAFVVSEIALSVMLVIAAGLCIRGTAQARRIDLGLDPDHVLIADLRLGMNGYTEQDGMVFYRQLQQRLLSHSGLEDVALVSWLPLGLEGGKGMGLDIPGYDRRPGEDMSADCSIVSPRYFETFHIPLVDGRGFRELDDADAPSVAVINETMARRYWPGRNPIGRTFRGWGNTFKIIGVAKTGKYLTLREAPRPFVYVSFLQVPSLDLSVAVRSAGDPLGLLTVVREQIRALDPGVRIWAAMPMSEYVEGAFFPQRIALGLLVGLGVVALILSAMGIFAVMAHSVGQRTQEISVRMALGASPGDVLALIIGGGIRLTLIGLLAGLGGAFAMTRFLTGFLYGVSPLDFGVFAGTAVIAVAATVLACLLPARRASRVDPMKAVRYE